MQERQRISERLYNEGGRNIHATAACIEVMLTEGDIKTLFSTPLPLIIRNTGPPRFVYVRITTFTLPRTKGRSGMCEPIDPRIMLHAFREVDDSAGGLNSAARFAI